MLKKTIEIHTPYFGLWIFISSFFTSAGGVVLVYAPYRTEHCRFGAVITSAVLQGAALVISIIALAIINRRAINKFAGNVQYRDRYICRPYIVWKFIWEETPIPTLLQVIIQMVVNIICIIIVVFFLISDDCGNFAYNAISSISATVGGLLIGIIQSFQLKRTPLELLDKSGPSRSPLDLDLNHPSTSL